MQGARAEGLASPPLVLVPRWVWVAVQDSTNRKLVSAVFVFNKNYGDHEQVAPYFDAFVAVGDEITSSGAYPYNNGFRGRIPGIEGPDEDTAIYLLQRLRELRELDERVAAFKAEGAREITREELAGKVMRGTVVCVGFYMGGTGWKRYDDVRLLLNAHGSPVVLPKGKRTNGYYAEGRILFKAAA